MWQEDDIFSILNISLIGVIISPVLLSDTFDNFAYIFACFAIVRKQFDQR